MLLPQPLRYHRRRRECDPRGDQEEVQADFTVCAAGLHNSLGFAKLTHLNGTVIHPDKCPHERAPEAFDLLKKVRRIHLSRHIRWSH
jgi:hypothetical protein